MSVKYNVVWKDDESDNATSTDNWYQLLVCLIPLFLPYGISQVKINGNKSYYTFTEHYGHPPFKNLMQDFLSSLGTNDDELLKEKLMNYLTAPSLKILI